MIPQNLNLTQMKEIRLIEIVFLDDMFNQTIPPNIHMIEMVISLPLLNTFACVDSVMFGVRYRFSMDSSASLAEPN